MSRYGGPSWPPPEPPTPRGLDLRRRYPSVRPSGVHGEGAGRRDVRQVEAPSGVPEARTRDDRGTALRQHNEEVRERRRAEAIDERRLLANCELVRRGGDYQDAELLEDTLAFSKSRSPVSERNTSAASLQTSRPRSEAMQRAGSSPTRTKTTLDSSWRERSSGRPKGSGSPTEGWQDSLPVADVGGSRRDRDAPMSQTSPSAVSRDTKEADTKGRLRLMPRKSSQSADPQDGFEYARRALPISSRARDPTRKLENTRTDPPKTGRRQLQPRPIGDLQQGVTSSSSGGSRRTWYRTESMGGVDAAGDQHVQTPVASATQARFRIAPTPTASRLSISSAKCAYSRQAESPKLTSPRARLSTDQDENGSEILASMEKDMTCPICMSIVVAAHALSPCGHTMCGACAFEWTREQSTCPICRKQLSTPTSSALIPLHSMDALIERWVAAQGSRWEGLQDYKDRVECWDAQRVVAREEEATVAAIVAARGEPSSVPSALSFFNPFVTGSSEGWFGLGNSYFQRIGSLPLDSSFASQFFQHGHSSDYLGFFDEGLEEWALPSRILADAFAGIGELRRQTGGGLGR